MDRHIDALIEWIKIGILVTGLIAATSLSLYGFFVATLTLVRWAGLE